MNQCYLHQEISHLGSGGVENETGAYHMSKAQCVLFGRKGRWGVNRAKELKDLAM